MSHIIDSWVFSPLFSRTQFNVTVLQWTCQKLRDFLYSLLSIKLATLLFHLFLLLLFSAFLCYHLIYYSALGLCVIIYLVISLTLFGISQCFKSTFTAVSEQFQSIFRAILEHFKNIIFRIFSEQFQSTFRALLEHF